MASEATSGVYFNPDSKEITIGGPDEPALEPAWVRISDDNTLGLISVRQLLVERGFVDDASLVYWYFPQATEEPTIPPPCEVPPKGRSRGGLFGKARSALFGGGRGLALR